MKHNIIIAKMSNGNVSVISRHRVTTAKGAARLCKSGHQIWMTEKTAEALGATVETFWGHLPGGTEIMIKTAEFMKNA